MDSTSKIARIGTAKARSKGYHQRKRVRDRRTFLLLAMPAVLVFVLVMLWPMANMFYLSLVQWYGIVKPKTFVGLANYARLFGDRHFRRAVVNTGIHLLIGMPGVLPPAFMLGFFLSQLCLLNS